MDLSNLTTIKELNQAMEQLGLLVPVYYEDDTVWLLDQLLLPFQEEYIPLRSTGQVAQAILDMKTRGAGAIAATAAYGLLQRVRQGATMDELRAAGAEIVATRPTASGMAWIVDQILALNTTNPDLMEATVVRFIAAKIMAEMEIARAGATLIDDGDTILTHCHAGAIAGIGYGGITFGVFRQAVADGKAIRVIATETRPYLQGARITSWELKKVSIPVTLITDNAAGHFLSCGAIQKVVVGADRVLLNGDVANKVGTYMIALAAKAHKVPFYVGVSRAGLDFATAKGTDIPIEMRDSREVTDLGGKRIATPGVEALYPAFDITPGNLVSAFITEQGIIKPPFIDIFKGKYKTD